MSRNLLLTAASAVTAAVVLSACGSTVTVSPSAGTTTTTSSASSTTTSETPTETTTSETPTSETTSETPSETTTSETTSSEAPSPSTSVDAIHKAAFLKVVKQRFPTITDEQAFADGQFVCDEMGQDKNILTVIGDLKEKHSDWSTTNAGYFLGVSIGALCPQYTAKVTAS